MDSVVLGFCGLGIQCTGGFITQENCGFCCQRPGNTHPLFLSAGKLGDISISFVVQLHDMEHFFDAFSDLLLGDALQDQWNRNILEYGFGLQ